MEILVSCCTTRDCIHIYKVITFYTVTSLDLERTIVLHLL